MDSKKAKSIAIKVAVTFVEAAAAYLTATNGWGHLGQKTVLAGLVGAGLSAVYNLARHYAQQ